MNFRAAPFFRLVVPFALGIALYGWLGQPMPPTVAAPALGCLGLLLFVMACTRMSPRWTWVFGVLLNLSFLLLGYTLSDWHNDTRDPLHFAPHLPAQHGWVAEVVSAPSHGATLKVRVQVQGVFTTPDSLLPTTGNALLFLKPDSVSERFRYGDRLLVRATLRPTEGPKNPHAFDYGRYLHFQNINYTAFVKSDSVEVLSSGHGHWWWRAAWSCRDRLLTLLQKHFPSENEYAVACALLLGYTDDLSDDLRTAYAQTGSMHALAVSGTHIGLLYTGIMFLLLRLPLYGRRGRLIETGILLLLIWGFTFLTGASASVLRASVMFSTFLIGKATFRQTSIWNVLSSSGFLLLFFNPYLLFDAGFQLSYSAVAGMAFFYPLFLKVSPVISSKWLDEAWKVLLVGCAAQLGTLPLSLYYFHQFPCYFWLAGWVVVAGGALFLWGGAVLVLLDFTVPVLADYLGQALYWMLWLMNKAVFVVQQLPGSVVSGIWVTGPETVVLYGIIAAMGAAAVLRRARWVVWSAAGVALLSGLHSWRAVEQQHQQRVTIYSVNKSRLIDLSDGWELYTLADTEVSRKQEEFAAQSNRWCNGLPARADSLERFNFQMQVSGPLNWQPPLLQFANLRLAIVDDVSVLQQTENVLAVDVLLLSKSARVHVADCLKKFPATTVVADASNSWYKAAAWEKECAELGVTYHNIKTQGAWEWVRGR